MFKTAFLLFLLQFLKVDSKFYETDIAPYGYGQRYGSYSTDEYNPEVGHPYGLSYKRYPDIPYNKVSRTIEYEEPIAGPIGLKYERGLEYPGNLENGEYYGAAGAYSGYPGGISRRVSYGYGSRPGLGYNQVYNQGLGPLSHQGLGPLSHQGLGAISNQGLGPLSHQGLGPISNYGLGPISPYGGFNGHNTPYGISQIDKGIYNDEKQNLIGEQFNHAKGYNGESLNHGDVGFNKGEVAYKDIKGDSLHFVDSDGVNRGHHEGKTFSGGENYNTEGKHGNEKVLNANHNKGHNIKGFKKSHHLDETGKTEEFFDHDHDAGGNYAFDGRFGKFGEQGGNYYKGGFNDGRFKTGEATKQGHYDNEYLSDKAQGGSGKFGGNKYAQNDEAYGLKKGFGEHGLSGRHENSNIYKNYPVGYGGYY